MFDWCLQTTLSLLSNKDYSLVGFMIEIKVMIEILTVSGALATIFGVAYTVVKDKLPKRNNNLDGVKDILARIDEIRIRNKYVQELELNAVPCLKGLRWVEADALLDKDIGLITLSNLRSLSRRNLIAVYKGEIFIPNKQYLIKKYLRNPFSYVIVIFFICIVLFFLYSVIEDTLNSIQNFGLFIFILLSEFVALYHFDSLTSLNMIKNTGDIANEKVFISQDFKKDLQRYKVWKLKYERKNIKPSN